MAEAGYRERTRNLSGDLAGGGDDGMVSEDRVGGGEVKTKYPHIHFIEIPTQSKTSVWSCYVNNSSDELGQIRWYVRWGQYCYFPVAQAIYSADCLNDIAYFIMQL